MSSYLDKAGLGILWAKIKAYVDSHSGGGSSVTVDSALSTTSENPVQNKVITGSLPVWTEWLDEGSYTTTTANAWEYTGFSITIPSGHAAILTANTTYNNGRPYGIGFNTSSTVSSTFGAPAMNIQSPSSSQAVVRATFLVQSGTYYLFNKRAATGSNRYTIKGFLYKV